MLLHHLSEVNSKSVDTERLILKSCIKEVVDQSCKIRQIFGRNEDKYNLVLRVYCCFIFPFNDSHPLLVEGTFTVAPSYL